MRIYYFLYNGKTYNSEDLIPFNFFDNRICKSYTTKVKFLYYENEIDEYFVEVYGNKYGYKSQIFYKNLRIQVCNENINNVAKQHNAFVEELNIDGLLVAWIWYIFAMCIGTIFYDRVYIWILASIIFFSYRNKKLKEEN